MARRVGIGLLAGAMWIPACVWAQEVVAVLSSDLAPYREAYAGFVAGFGESVPQLLVADGTTIGARTRLVVAFGGKAAVRTYPTETTLVYCMAPGTVVDATPGTGARLKVHMVPQPRVFLDKLRMLQPGIRRLGVLWTSPALEPELQQLVAAGSVRGPEILLFEVSEPKQLPQRLREAAAGRVEALYLIHDPKLVNESTFATLKEFCWMNRVPLYAPNPGLVEKGATASIGVSFRAIGTAAAVAARDALAGHTASTQVYADQCEIVINLTAAAKTGLRTTEEILKRADKVIP